MASTGVKFYFENLYLSGIILFNLSTFISYIV
jgi:hypothetical protein